MRRGERSRNIAGTKQVPLENNVIDELVGGDLDREEFLRRATMFGLGAGTIGMLLRYVGEADVAFGAQLEQVQAGGTLRLGITAPGSSLEPWKLNEGGSLAFAGIPGEYLTFTDPQARVRPALAASWRPNRDATAWTFQLRRGVRFHNGQEMTSRDVVASMKHYVSEGSNAGLSPYFAAGGVSARGKYTVVFRLKAPLGTFPYLLSQTTYQAIIQPASIVAKPDTWVTSGMIGTGAFRLVPGSYREKRSAQLVRNDRYWGGRPPLDGVRITFYQGTAPMVLALRSGQIDLAFQLSSQEARPFKNNSRYTYYSQPASRHRQVCMRTDNDLFRDARVRRAMALAINRPQQIARVMLGDATLGNDNPFWNKFLSTPPGIPQRRQNLDQARSLLRAANAEDLKFTLTTWDFLEHTDHAASLQVYARQAGIEMGIEVASNYYDSEPPGADYATTTPWLNRPATLTEYGWRGVPNIYITRCYMSDGDWNASHYKNPAFDRVARAYLAAPEVAAQRRAVRQMAAILARDTPVIIDYFDNYVTASSARVRNYVPEAISQVRLAKVGLR